MDSGLDFLKKVLYNKKTEREVIKMTEEKLKENIARNMVELRKANGYTQTEIAEKLTYSDKSVSKWERGEGLPDLLVLNKLADLYGVSFDDLTGDKIPEPQTKSKLPHLTDRIIIPLLTVGGIFLLASFVFFALRFFGYESSKSALVFLYAVPVSCIPLIVFFCLWFGLAPRFISISALIWSVFVCIIVSLPMESLKLLLISAGIMQFIVVLCWIMCARAKARRENNRSRSKV